MTWGAAAAGAVAGAIALSRVAARASAAAPPVSRPRVAASKVRLAFEARLDSLSATISALERTARAGEADAARRAFRDARRLYKRSELLFTYYSPTATAAINGPLEADDPDAPPRPLGEPAAFQAAEDALFGDSVDTRGAAGAARRIATSIAPFRAATFMLDVSDTAALDAARLELARISTVGIAGVDAGASGDAIHESAAAVQGIEDAVAGLASSKIRAISRATTIALLDSARASLERQPSFVSFDRFAFVTRYAMPAARAVAELRREVDRAPVASRRLWRAESASPYEANAFDAWALAPEYAQRGSPASVALGAALFNDPRLSGSGTRSCASCHVPSRAFTDGRARAASMSSRAHDAPARNTPTLLNAALQPQMFADQRAGFVEDQIRIVLSSPAEMASSPQLAADRIGRQPTYAPLVRAAFGTPAPIGERHVREALAAYVRSLVALSSPFDRAIRGDSSAISDDARRGFNLFMGKAKCGTCHFAPLFGGTMPPDFTRSELEIIGVPSTNVTHDTRVDTDSGRALVDGQPVHAGAFRVPSVRNAAVTSPYMHNGVYRTLEQVIEFYDRGGGAGMGATLSTQTLPRDPLKLSAAEKRDLVAFLRSLTDERAGAVSSP